MSLCETKSARLNWIAAIGSVLLHMGLLALIAFTSEASHLQTSASIELEYGAASDLESAKQDTQLEKSKPLDPVKKVVTQIQPAVTSKTSEMSIAPVDQESALAAAGGQQATDDARRSYILRLRSIIEKGKAYPLRARQLGLSGRVIVSFTILESGKIVDIKISKPCHHNLLNESAIEIVENIESFEPIPRELGLSQWPMHIPIDFAYNR